MAENTYPQITIRVTQYEYKLLKKFKDEHGLSVRDVLALSGCPCQYCRGTESVVFDGNGEIVKIPKGILCKRNT